MSGAFGAFITSVQAKTGAITSVGTCTVAVPAGSLVVVGFGAPTGATTSGCTDSQGNTYTKVIEEDGGNRYGTVFVSKITTALTTSDTITVSHSSVQPRVMTANYFTGVDSVQNCTANGSSFTSAQPNPTSGATGTPTDAAALYIGAYFGNSTITDTYTDDSDTTGGSGWTKYDSEGTSGGSNSTNQNLRMSYKFSTTLAAQTYNPVASGSRNCAIMVMGFKLLSGTTFNQSCQATMTPVASLTRSTSKGLSATNSPIASLVRSTSKYFNASNTPLASLARTTSKLALATMTPVATLSRSIALMRRATNAPLASLALSTSKSFQASNTPVASLSKGSLFLKNLQATMTPIASLTRTTSKSLQASVTPIASLTRIVGKYCLASVTPIASLSKTTYKSFQAVCSPIATLIRDFTVPFVPNFNLAVHITGQWAKRVIEGGKRSATVLLGKLHKGNIDGDP